MQRNGSEKKLKKLDQTLAFPWHDWHSKRLSHQANPVDRPEADGNDNPVLQATAADPIFRNAAGLAIRSLN
jgi:hypothetical protein